MGIIPLGIDLDAQGDASLASSLALDIARHIEGEVVQRQEATADAGSLRGSAAVAPAAGVFRRIAPEPHTPLSNTGVFATFCLIDALRCTFPASSTSLDLAKMMFGPGLEWTLMEKGGRFYDSCLRRGHVSIYYGGNGDTVLVEAMGKGCRQLEAEGVLDVPDASLGIVGGWRGFFADLQEMGCTFPRVDWAFDDTEGVLDLDVIEANLLGGHCATRFREWERRKPRRNKNRELKGDSVNLGSRSSQMFVRIYNKHLEQLQKGEEVLHPKWIRTEVEAHDRGADALVKKFCEQGAAAVAGVLRRYVDFKEASNDSNVSRRATCSWWLQFLDNCEKMELGLSPLVKTLEGTARAFAGQWGAGLAMLLASPKHGMEWLRGVVEVGQTRWKSKHINLLSVGLAPCPTGCPCWACKRVQYDDLLVLAGAT